MTPARLVALGIVLLGASITAGCAPSTTNEARHRSADALTPPSAAPGTTSPSATLAPAPCGNREASLSPDSTIAPDSYMAEIREMGRLTVGVDQDTRPFGFRDPRTGKIDGLDVDLLRAVARSIFDVPAGEPIDDKIDFRAISTSERISAVARGDVDIVASLITATCERQRAAGLSSVYYRAQQDVLVRNGDAITSIEDLAGKRVCAAAGSTSLVQFRRLVPTARMHPVAARTDCLVALQDGVVDAITADDTILLGFRDQDANTQVLGTSNLSDEPYVLAVAKGHPEFVRFVNAVLQRMREGELQGLYQRWLGADAPPVPEPTYQG
jgi:polar amino acid transport system substrate-binding protein